MPRMAACAVIVLKIRHYDPATKAPKVNGQGVITNAPADRLFELKDCTAAPAVRELRRRQHLRPIHALQCTSCSTHCLRQAGALNGSAKYCASCDTLPSRNSMMLTVYAAFPA